MIRLVLRPAAVRLPSLQDSLDQGSAYGGRRGFHHSHGKSNAKNRLEYPSLKNQQNVGRASAQPAVWWIIGVQAS